MSAIIVELNPIKEFKLGCADAPATTEIAIFFHYTILNSVMGKYTIVLVNTGGGNVLDSR